jgi:hypothetical protein
MNVINFCCDVCSGILWSVAVISTDETKYLMLTCGVCKGEMDIKDLDKLPQGRFVQGGSA